MWEKFCLPVCSFSVVLEVPLRLSIEEGRISTEIQGCLGNHEEHHLIGSMGGEMPLEEPNRKVPDHSMKE